jgi:hypothetical protein
MCIGGSFGDGLNATKQAPKNGNMSSPRYLLRANCAPNRRRNNCYSAACRLTR